MRRRELMVALGAAAAWPVAAQTSVARVGVLQGAPPSFPGAVTNWQAFTAGMRERGWTEGGNIQFEIRWTGGRDERYPELAAELVALRPGLIIAANSLATRALKDQTDRMPIVMIAISSPVRAGFVASLARPGGNITGYSIGDVHKQLEFLKEIRTGISRIAILWDPKSPGSAHGEADQLAAASQVGIAIELIAVSAEEELEAAFSAIAERKPDALMVHGVSLFLIKCKEIAAFAIEQRLPTGTGSSAASVQMVRDGLLMSYSANGADIWRRAPDYVDRILKGTKPADLPVQEPSKFDLVLNLRTARAIGLDLPPLILARADEVIE